MKIGERSASEFNAISILFTKPTINSLIEFLKIRESDIAENMENFGLLRDLFVAVIGREPVDNKLRAENLRDSS